MVFKIGVLSDTHLNKVTGELREIYKKYMSDADLVLHAGDIVSLDVVDFLSRDNFRGVCGNMDPAEVKSSLPVKMVIEAGPYRIGLIHGWGSSEGIEERIFQKFANVDAIVYGHSHKAVNHTKNGVLFFNPGTATGYTSLGIHSIGILELGDEIRGRIINL